MLDCWKLVKYFFLDIIILFDVFLLNLILFEYIVFCVLLNLKVFWKVGICNYCVYFFNICRVRCVYCIYVLVVINLVIYDLVLNFFWFIELNEVNLLVGNDEIVVLNYITM